MSIEEALSTIYCIQFRSYEDFCNSETNKTSVFYRYIQNKFDEFVEILKSIKKEDIESMLQNIGDDFNGKKSKFRFINFTKRLCRGYLTVLKECYNPNHRNALSLLENYIGRLPSKTSNLPNLKQYIGDYLINYAEFVLVENKVYYRLRDEWKENEVNNCWHTPYYKRQNSYDGRFSKAGFPCFYIAEDIETSMAELGEIPKGKVRWVGKFTISESSDNYKKPPICIDLRVPSVEKIKHADAYERFCMIVNFPLILLSTTKTYNKSDSFAEEYLFSQTLMEVLSNPFVSESGVIGFRGICYNSTKHLNGVNYVFPAPSQRIPPKDETYSIKLQSIFSPKPPYQME